MDSMNFNNGNMHPAESFKKFLPRSEKKKQNKQMLDEQQAFDYNPRKFFC